MCRVEEKLKQMVEVLLRAQQKNYDIANMVKKLRAMLQSAEENDHMLKKQGTFLSQLAAKTVPKGLHCFSMQLTVEYHLFPHDVRELPNQQRLEDPSLYHYALLSDNILAAAVVVNSAILNAKVCSQQLSSPGWQCVCANFLLLNNELKVLNTCYLHGLWLWESMHSLVRNSYWLFMCSILAMPWKLQYFVLTLSL